MVSAYGGKLKSKYRKHYLKEELGNIHKDILKRLLFIILIKLIDLNEVK